METMISVITTEKNIASNQILTGERFCSFWMIAAHAASDFESAVDMRAAYNKTHGTAITGFIPCKTGGLKGWFRCDRCDPSLG